MTEKTHFHLRRVDQAAEGFAMIMLRPCVLTLVAGMLTGCGENELDRLLLEQGSGMLENAVGFERRTDPRASYAITYVAPQLKGRVETVTSRYSGDDGWRFVRHEIDCVGSRQREIATGRNTLEFISARRAQPKWEPVLRASIPDTVGSFACKKAGFRTTALDAKLHASDEIVVARKVEGSTGSERMQPLFTPTKVYGFQPSVTRRHGAACNSTGAYGEISCITGRPKTIKVQGYRRKDGTYVKSHHRSSRRRR